MENNNNKYSVLVVDDEPGVLAAMHRLLRRQGYHVVTASGGRAGLEILADSEIDLIISDLKMPQMDGITFLEQAARDFPLVIRIMFSAHSDFSDMVEAVNRCNIFQFFSKPFEDAQLLLAIRRGLQQRVLQQSRIKLLAEVGQRNLQLREAHGVLKKDLEAASLLQKSMLPEPSTLAGIQFDWLFHPSAFVAGDAFGYFPLGKDYIVFYILDVAGHGAAAALHSFTLQQMIRTFKTSGLPSPPHEVVAHLNAAMPASTATLPYFTIVYGLIKISTGRVELCQAGHPHPLLQHGQNNRVEQVGEAGFPVALLPDAQWESTTLDLQPGDRLYLCSDGVMENEALGQQGLEQIIQDSGNIALSAVLEKVENSISSQNSNRDFADDFTILALERTPTAETRKG